MFFNQSASILFIIVTVLLSGTLAAFLPTIAKKARLTKYFPQTVIDIVTALLAVYAITGLITLLAALFVWLASFGPFGHDEYRW